MSARSHSAEGKRNEIHRISTASLAFVSIVSLYFHSSLFFSGVGVGGSIPVVWTYFAEFQPSNKRGAALSILASFWMVGNLTVAGLAWAIIPHQVGWDDPDGFKYNSWRSVNVVIDST